VELKHSIKVVSRRTGLSPHLIRVWEKRYSTTQPHRNDVNRRLYSVEDIERLRLLKRATDSGHSIGDIAHLPTERLAQLVKEDAAQPGAGAVEPERPRAEAVRGEAKGDEPGAAELVGRAYAAVEAMDSVGLESVLDMGSVQLGQIRLLTDVIVPLVERIGEAWRLGELKVAHEHVASAAIRTFLGHVSRPISLHPSAPVLVTTTPSGQLHELGAVLVSAAATNIGWRVVYAGACLPSEEIVSVVRAHRAKAVALSIVHPEDDPHLADELKRLRRLLPAGIPILVGGRAAAAYQSALDEIGARRVIHLGGLSALLERIRGER
jgi:DNA-binding transcriptional MerR regulator/methylmalonyl-CoA mutase cobalamin-binding subunit